MKIVLFVIVLTLVSIACMPLLATLLLAWASDVILLWVHAGLLRLAIWAEA